MSSPGHGHNADGGGNELPQEEKQAYRDLGVPDKVLEAEPRQLAAARSQVPVAWTQCPACGHPRSSHQPDDRLPGDPWLCLESIGSFVGECGCDGEPTDGGQATIRFYDRIALVMNRDAAYDWWLTQSAATDASPVDLLCTRRLEQLDQLVAAAERDALTPEALRRRAHRFLMPSVYESWLDGTNEFLEGARPRDLIALGQLARVADALDAEEQKAYGG